MWIVATDKNIWNIDNMQGIELIEVNDKYFVSAIFSNGFEVRLTTEYKNKYTPKHILKDIIRELKDGQLIYDVLHRLRLTRGDKKK